MSPFPSPFSFPLVGRHLRLARARRPRRRGDAEVHRLRQRPQFRCDQFRRWCRKCGIRPRFGAIGSHGSIAVVERFIRTLKESLARWPLIPFRRERLRKELHIFADWYNEHRPHVTLGGRTANEVYDRRRPAHRSPRFEPRSDWPRGSPCARPWALVRGNAGALLELEVTRHAGYADLPVIGLRRVA